MLKAVHPGNIGCFMSLSQQYEAEFGYLTGKRPNGAGLYAITLPDATHEAWLAEDHAGLPVGFAVVDIGRERWDIAEFYIVPALRKQQIGKRLARAVFERYPGPWQVRQIQGAEGAYRFWIAAISEYSGGQYTDAVENDPEWGIVRIQRFDSPVTAPEEKGAANADE